LSFWAEWNGVEESKYYILYRRFAGIYFYFDAKIPFDKNKGHVQKIKLHQISVSFPYCVLVFHSPDWCNIFTMVGCYRKFILFFYLLSRSMICIVFCFTFISGFFVVLRMTRIGIFLVKKYNLIYYVCCNLKYWFFKLS
jgi:hypothetical protein